MVKSNGKRKKNEKSDYTFAAGWNIADSTRGPSKKMSKLQKWIESDNFIATEGSRKKTSEGLFRMNESLTQIEFKTRFSKHFSKSLTYKDSRVSLMNCPFQVAVVDNFLADPLVIPLSLLKEIECLEFTRKQMDLYEFHQSTDLINVKSRNLAKFYNFINRDVRAWMEELTGMKFQRVSASCSMYNCGDYLLSHDDLLSDRLIAFVFYLSPWKNHKMWSEDMGGALELFSTDTDGQPVFPSVHKIFPVNNQLVFFKVDRNSHHQVGECLTKDYPRLTINGWFHGFQNNIDYNFEAMKLKMANVPSFQSPNNISQAHLDKIINKSYLKDSVKRTIQKQIEENSEAALGEFLQTDFFDKVAQEINAGNLKWILKGPPNQQNYEILDHGSLPKASSLKKLLDIMASQQFFKFLHENTELDLYGKNSNSPKCTVEFQKWTGGNYTLINDPSTYSDDTLDLIFYIGDNENVGVVTYLNPEGHQDDESIIYSDNAEEDNVLLTVYPQNNFLNLVYRSAGTAKFTKYCPKSTVMNSEANYILFCSYKE